MPAGTAFSRRRFLGVSVASAVASAGAYGLIERLAPPQARWRADLVDYVRRPDLPVEQYLFCETAVVANDGVEVDVPPLHHEVVTATLKVDPSAAALRRAGAELEKVLSSLEDEGLLTYTPAGLGLAVVWGLPYFATFIDASVRARYLPLDVASPKVDGAYRQALLASLRFATDPDSTILEENHVAVVMASDSLTHLANAYSAIFEGSVAGLFEVTSRRKGFVDATKLGKSGQSLTKQFALANKLPEAASIPDQSPLFLGFTSSQTAAQGQRAIANFESLGMTNQKAGSYFAGGTVLALSHLFENLGEWYSRNAYTDRVDIMFRPGLGKSTKKGTLTLSESDPEDARDIESDIGAYGLVGHAGSMQPVSRLQADKNGYSKGAAIPVRADFNTVDNPFAYSSDPARDGWSSYPQAGLHFLTYVPTSSYFTQLRAAMDGGLKAGSAPFQAFVNSAVLHTTHRQNFLVPPRAHRSFPLVEFL
ncbi:MAG TPA: hypothetical protein VGP46_09185 [Acidimicrobiales bacterium]|jgi:hypothetical protein|nr:hypothetical protein [Acidimicrobiales bacterium]